MRVKILSVLGGLFVLTGMALWFGGLLYIFGTLKTFRATARIALEPGKSAIVPDGSKQQNYDENFVEIEAEKMRSKNVLFRVIENLGLNDRFAKALGRSETLKASETFALLIRRVDVRQVENTQLCEISVTSDRATEAAEIANEIARVYRDTRLELFREMEQKQIGDLRAFLQTRESAAEAAGERVKAFGTRLNIEGVSSLEAIGDLVNQDEKYRPYFEAVKELSQLQKIVTAIQLRIAQDESDYQLPSFDQIQIVDLAEAPLRAVGPNLNTVVLLFVAGLAFNSAGAVLVVRLFGNRAAVSLRDSLEKVVAK